MATESFLDFEAIEVAGKRVFLRLDLNVPLQDSNIIDDTRIQASLPTLHQLAAKGAKLIVASHLGRPKTDEDRQKLSLEPVARRLNEEGFEVLLMESPDSEAPYELAKSLSGKQIILLENLRFDEGETQNSGTLAAKWAKYTDVYVNDAFGASHRAHASIDALARLIPDRCYGPLIKKELDALGGLRSNPNGPVTLVTGGSKVSDKLPLLESLADQVDNFLIGGAMAYSFLAASNLPVGGSRVEADKVGMAQRFLKQMESSGKKVYLPVDHVVVPEFSSDEWRVQDSVAIQGQDVAVDIGPKTCSLFSDVIKSSGTIFWNGPMGVYERTPFDKGSLAIAKAMAETSGFTVIGGGDSAAAAVDSGFAENMDHISTGGGASLEFIQGIKLPGIEALKVRRAE